ncbi:hypothetical protein [Paenibacillus xerothermodurans]|uniref:hypothetical protein n=1 Tax=Paenibacillus xerothermodurans TaxID=1977292 RepID=UPI001FB301FA|nr:hypothetical protein [Paenibacillus xerothermodurans]
MAVMLVSLHWVYLLFILLIIAFMIMRRDTAIVCIAGIFILGLLATLSLYQAVSGLFFSFIYAMKELLGTILIISIIAAMARALTVNGINETMIAPFARLIRTPALAYWLIGILMMIISLFFWPSPAVALVGALLLPVAVRIGLPPVGAAAAMNLFGHGIALSGDYIIQGAPKLTADAAGIPVGDVLQASIPLVLVMGVVTTCSSFWLLRRDMRTGKLRPEALSAGAADSDGSESASSSGATGDAQLSRDAASAGAAGDGQLSRDAASAGAAGGGQLAGGTGTIRGVRRSPDAASAGATGGGQPAGGTGNAQLSRDTGAVGGVRACGEAVGAHGSGGGLSRTATGAGQSLGRGTRIFFAVLIPLLFMADVAVMFALNLQGGDATALVGGTALIIMLIITLTTNRQGSLEQATRYLVEGFQFGFKIFGPVIPIAAFFYLGDSAFDTIFGKVLPAGSHGLVNDLGLALAHTVPVNEAVGAMTLTAVGAITGLDGSGFSGISLTGSIATMFAAAIGSGTATLTALGQVAAIWVGGGTLVPWALIPAAAICGVDPFELARRNLKPVVLGLGVTTIVAMFLV